MKNYEILEHKADLKIRVFGATKEELFLNALLGMEEYLKPQLVGGRYQAFIRDVKVKSTDLAALIIDFLNETLYLIQTNKEFYGDIKFKNFTETMLEAELYGRKSEGFSEDIKAATYHDLNIKQKEDGTWEAVVLFDI